MTRLADAPPLPVFFAAGALYAAWVFFACGFRMGTPPATLGGYFVLAFLVLFLGLAHGASAAFAAALFAQLPGVRHRPLLVDASVALALGLFYAGLGLSWLKLGLTRSPLRFEDLWFVF